MQKSHNTDVQPSTAEQSPLRPELMCQHSAQVGTGEDAREVAGPRPVKRCDAPLVRPRPCPRCWISPRPRPRRDPVERFGREAPTAEGSFLCELAPV